MEKSKMPTSLKKFNVNTRCKRWAILIAVLFFVLLVNSNATFAQIKAERLRPSLVAIQVESLDQSIEWYLRYLNFTLFEKKELKDRGLSLAILTLEDFKIELVENQKSLKRNAVLKRNEATDITGFAKLTFTIENVSEVYQQLKEKGGNFAIPLSDSKINPQEQFFILLDSENNWLQFMGPK